ncbi:MAG: acyltransferase family protein, partial [Synergistaceae bacterium]|nr:acyltransferase family protein [Synergistaceae bacterium]
REQRAESREHYFDFLRAALSLAVIFTHVMAQDWGASVKDEYHIAFNVYNALTWEAVPVFVMISGSLFLRRDISMRKLYGKYIFRIFTAFVFWSSVYALRSYVKEGASFRTTELFITGNYHLWFRPMITGLYMITPFMKVIAASGKLTGYFLVLSLIFAFILPQTSGIVMHFSERYGRLLEKFSDGFGMFFVMGYAGYFLLGYVMSKITMSRTLERVIYALGLAGLCASVISPSDRISVNVLLESVAVFVFFMRHFASDGARIIRLLSRYSFGVYLVHVAVLNAVVRYSRLLVINPILGIPSTAVVVFVISLTVSALLNKLPVLNKYIV